MKEKSYDLPPILKRNRYFAGQVLTADDFQTEQQYFINRLKLHNRSLHGYGVASGLNITASNDNAPALHITVSPGTALDPKGNIVVVSSPQRIPFPVNGDEAYLCIRWAEREIDSLPVPGIPAGSQELTQASAVEEYAILTYENKCPSAKHKRPCEDGIGCCDQHGLALAHLLNKRGVWKIDKRFRVHRVFTKK